VPLPYCQPTGPGCQGGRLTVTLPLPFVNSRRLGHENPFVLAAGVALDVVGIDLDAELFAGWRKRIERARELLGWPAASFVRPGTTTTLAFAAPVDQLTVAIEVNEWALCAALADRDPGHWGCLRDALRQEALAVGSSGHPCPPPEIVEAAAFERFRRLAATAAGN
jgi:hypothetical protein